MGRARACGESPLIPSAIAGSTDTPGERARHGVRDGLIRLSAGLEDAADILSDLDDALGVGRPARAGFTGAGNGLHPSALSRHLR